MCTLVTHNAPAFSAQAVMPDNSFQTISLGDFRGRYLVLFFYPLDFTFVCPSEILAFNRAVPVLKERGTEVVGVSVDSVYTHFAWRNTPVKDGGIGQIGFSLISDLNKDISRAYGVLHNGEVALRGHFLIDKEGIVRHALINDLPLGRNVDEIVRMVDALQHFERYGDVCPANWKPGEEAMKPTAAGVAAYLSKHGG